jgi:lysophospholipase L1-like esterase
MSTPRLRSFLSVLAISGVLGACSATSSARGDTVLTGVGRIPGIGSSGAAVVVEGVRANLSAIQGPVLGSLVTGNKLLVIGDSILAGTASRYGGAMCSALTPMGWRVAVEAEAGQLVGFGRTVLRDRIYEGWDAAVVFLGTNYGGSAEKYQRDLTAIVESLAPRPMLLLTATLFRPTMNDVNNVIRTVAASHSNVTVLDWGSASSQPGLLNGDGIHPNNAGRAVLVQSIANALGNAPTSPGACLPSKYTDDTMGREFMPTTSVAGAADPDIPYAVVTTVPSATTTIATATTVVPSQSTTTVAR